MSHLSARSSALSRLTPLTLARISVAFAAIAAVWLTVASVHAEVIATRRGGCRGGLRPRRPGAGRRAVRDGRRVGPGRLRHARRVPGLRGDRHGGRFPRHGQLGLAGSSLGGTFVAGFGGVGTAGVWRLAIMAVILTVLTAMADICVHGPALPGAGCACSARRATSGCRLPASPPCCSAPGGLPRRARPRRGRARRDDHRRHPSGARTAASCAATGATAGSRSGSASGLKARCRPCRRCSSGCSSPAC